MVQRFRTKIVEIEAMQFTGDNYTDMVSWMGITYFVPVYEKDRNITGLSDEFTAQVYDKLHETWIGVIPGQWIVRGVKGEYYPCDDETFHWKYEEVVA